jgi:hypothetical protein
MGKALSTHESKLQDQMQPERLGKLKKIIHIIESRSRDLPSCMIVL